MNKNYFIALAVAVLIAGVFFFMTHNNVAQAPTQEVIQNTDEEIVPTTNVLEYGEVEIGIGETAVFKDLKIKPVTVEEDSRCPIDVQCIQAGTVRLAIEIVSAMGTSTDILKLGESLTTEAQEITFVSVMPQPVAGAHIQNSAYSFTFDVVPEKTDVPVVVLPSLPVPVENNGACYVGGCSSQLCTDEADMASTCEYREEYACYQTATCKRQSSGECGWTPTSELRACLSGSI